MADIFGLSRSVFDKWWDEYSRSGISLEYSGTTQSDEYSPSQYQAVTSTTQGQLKMVVINPDSYDTIDFQFVPERLNLNRNIGTREIKPILRNTPIYHYTGGSTVLNFRLDFFANLDSRQDVIDRCRRIEALGYADGYDKAKQRVKLIWGSLFRDELWEVLSIKYELLDFKPDANFLPQQAYVDISLGLSVDYNIKRADVI